MQTPRRQEHVFLECLRPLIRNSLSGATSYPQHGRTTWNRTTHPLALSGQNSSANLYAAFGMTSGAYFRVCTHSNSSPFFFVRSSPALRTNRVFVQILCPAPPLQVTRGLRGMYRVPFQHPLQSLTVAFQRQRSTVAKYFAGHDYRSKASAAPHVPHTVSFCNADLVISSAEHLR